MNYSISIDIFSSSNSCEYLLSYTLSRYRWGKLIDAEPSRFIEEIDPQYINKIIPNDNYQFKPLVDTSIFGDQMREKRNLKPIHTKEKTITNPTPSQLTKLREINIGKTAASVPDNFVLKEGMEVEHARFGCGIVKSIEGIGNDKKAAIAFKGFGVKNLLLRFAKLKAK